MLVRASLLPPPGSMRAGERGEKAYSKISEKKKGEQGKILLAFVGENQIIREQFPAAHFLTQFSNARPLERGQEES